MINSVLPFIQDWSRNGVSFFSKQIRSFTSICFLQILFSFFIENWIATWFYFWHSLLFLLFFIHILFQVHIACVSMVLQDNLIPCTVIFIYLIFSIALSAQDCYDYLESSVIYYEFLEFALCTVMNIIEMFMNLPFTLNCFSVLLCICA